MKTTYWIAAMVVVGLGAGAIGMATSHGFGHGRPGFGMMRMNGMGGMPQDGQMFTRLDADGDGMISADEFAARKGRIWGGPSGNPGNKMMTE